MVTVGVRERVIARRPAARARCDRAIPDLLTLCLSQAQGEARPRPPSAAPAGPGGAGRARRATARVGQPAAAVRPPRHRVPAAGVRGQSAAHVREQSLREPAPGAGLPVRPQTHLAHTDASDTRAAECRQGRWREARAERSRAVSRASPPARSPRLQRWG